MWEADGLLEKVQVLQGKVRQRTPTPSSWAAYLEKEARAWFPQSPGLRWQMLGEAAVTASATQFKAQLAGLWAPGVRAGVRAQEAGRMPGPQPCTATPSVPLQSFPLWPQRFRLQTVQKPPLL